MKYSPFEKLHLFQNPQLLVQSMTLYFKEMS